MPSAARSTGCSATLVVSPSVGPDTPEMYTIRRSYKLLDGNVIPSLGMMTICVILGMKRLAVAACIQSNAELHKVVSAED